MKELIKEMLTALKMIEYYDRPREQGECTACWFDKTPYEDDYEFDGPWHEPNCPVHVAIQKAEQYLK